MIVKGHREYTTNLYIGVHGILMLVAQCIGGTVSRLTYDYERHEVQWDETEHCGCIATYAVRLPDM